MSPKDYERLVKRLMSTVFDGMDAHAFHLKKYSGKSGQEYEIDVSFELRIGTLEVIVLVECKRYAHRVTVQEVSDFAYRLRDTGAHKGIVVAPNGFQKGAIQVAKSERIALMVVSDEIEFVSTKLDTVLGMLRLPQYTNWFSTLAISTNSLQDNQHLEMSGRFFVPLHDSHEVVPFGEAHYLLGQPRLQRKALNAEAYLRTCFRLIEEDEAEGSQQIG